MLIKLEWFGYRMVKTMTSRFHLISACDGRTDGRTDKQNCYIDIARQSESADAR